MGNTQLPPEIEPFNFAPHVKLFHINSVTSEWSATGKLTSDLPVIGVFRSIRS
jgi:hypothetical protein